MRKRGGDGESRPTVSEARGGFLLTANPRGEYAFLPGIEPYSGGAVADDGFEVVHVTLRRVLPYRAGFDFIEAYLAREGRPRAALCGIELRSPAPFTRAGFAGFNQGYCEIIAAWELLVDDRNPVARTNVAPEWSPPAEPSLFAFSYTAPVDRGARRTFLVAGAGELRGGPLFDAQVVRAGEASAAAMREKAAYVLSAMSRRMEGLGVSWADVTCTEVYTRQDVRAIAGEAILPAIGAAAGFGLRWHPSRPPIDELEFEMDVRGVRQELIAGP